MGDITGDLSFYDQAWIISDMKLARAQKALGYKYFYNNQLEKAVLAFSLALSLNSYNSNIWFTKGCAHMKLE